MFKRAVAIGWVVALAVLLILMNTTDPTTINPAGVFIFFTMTFVVFYGLALLALNVGMLLKSYINDDRATLRKETTGTRQYLYAIVIALAGLSVLLAKSMGWLNLVGILGITLMASLGCALVAKRG